jgi:hypothetical protein
MSMADDVCGRCSSPYTVALAQQEEWKAFCDEAEYRIHDPKLRDCLTRRIYFRAWYVVVWLGFE